MVVGSFYDYSKRETKDPSCLLWRRWREAKNPRALDYFLYNILKLIAVLIVRVKFVSLSMNTSRRALKISAAAVNFNGVV